MSFSLARLFALVTFVAMSAAAVTRPATPYLVVLASIAFGGLAYAVRSAQQAVGRRRVVALGFAVGGGSYLALLCLPPGHMPSRAWLTLTGHELDINGEITARRTFAPLGADDPARQALQVRTCPRVLLPIVDVIGITTAGIAGACLAAALFRRLARRARLG